MKRLYYLFLCSLFANSLLWAQNEKLAINTVSQLRSFAAAVNTGESFAGTEIVLTTDIVLDEDEDWTPIGTTDMPFCGTFDGQGHTVSNLYVNAIGLETGNVAGFFGCIGTSGTVRRIGIESGIIRVATPSSVGIDCYIGGIAGLNGGHIEQCYNKATVLGNVQLAFVGGIAGANGNIGGGTTSALIEDCYNQGRVFTSCTSFSDMNYLGGIVGINDGAICHVYSKSSEISQAAYTNEITTNSPVASETVGGFYMGDLTGFTLDGGLNVQGDYTIWSFAEGELPELTCMLVSSSLLIGDVNQDGSVDEYDVPAMAEVLLGIIPENANADVNQDGFYTLADLTALVNILRDK